MEADNVVQQVGILGTGSAIPHNVVASSDLDHELKLPEGTVRRAGGVDIRYFAANRDNAATLGAKAAGRALAAAGLDAARIDCLIAASGTADQGMPCNGALLRQEIPGMRLGVPAFDVNMSCLSHVAALDLASWMVHAGRFRYILIVSSDIASCGLDWQRLEASAIFGDGAAATIIGPAGAGASSKILGRRLETYSEGADLCVIRGGGTRFHPTRIAQPFGPLALFEMDGKGVFKLASRRISVFVKELLREARCSKRDIDWVVPHQASQLALSHIAKRLEFPTSKIVNIFSSYGNQVAASLPTALDVAINDGRIRRGDTIMLLGTGAGVSLGGMVLEY